MPDPVPPAPVHSLKSPQTIIALYGMTIVAGIVGGVFWKGDAQLVTAISMSVVGVMVGAVTGFYFGSSTGSQAKDANNTPPASLPPVP